MSHKQKLIDNRRKALDTAVQGGRAGAPQSEAKQRALSFKRSSVSKVIDRDAVVDHLLGLLDDIQDGITRLNDLAVSISSEAPEAVWHELDDSTEAPPSDDDL